jgi:CBS domain containing-hemolysin-like protein
VTPAEWTTDAVRSIGANLVEMSGNWIGALAASLVGSVFAGGRGLLASMPMTRVSALRDDSMGRSKAALERYLEHAPRIQSRWLVGRVLCTALTAALISDAIRALPSRWTVVIAVCGTLATYGLLAELGTLLARRSPDRALPVLLRLLRPLEALIIPVAAPLTLLARAASRILPPPHPVDGRTTEHEVEILLAEGAKAGTLGEDRAEMIKKVLEFNDLTAVEVMVPRTSLTAIPADTPLDEVLRIIAQMGHSRYPVYRGTIDNIVGLLYAKDLLRALSASEVPDGGIEPFIRAPVNFVPETQPVSALLREMRGRRLHMAVVVDEYGGVSGIVTLEDIIEEIIGDIQDEHDAEENPIVELGDGRVLVDAAMPLDDLSRFLGATLPAEGDIQSVGGMLVSRAGHVPSAGSEVLAHGFRFVVREADERRVAKVEVSRVPSEGSASGRGADGSPPAPAVSS